MLDPMEANTHHKKKTHRAPIARPVQRSQFGKGTNDHCIQSGLMAKAVKERKSGKARTARSTTAQTPSSRRAMVPEVLRALARNVAESANAIARIVTKPQWKIIAIFSYSGEIRLQLQRGVDW